ncbi:M66 family metalloprotease [Massilia sp. CF038]|uniref:M66 family metalloprotease n=1 Tax=Massilia sp. CF038 TaxID=1881045 RepID=UPI0015B55F53|nr:M66 family metalloprotease [Massilia sp. CF038]
MATLGLSAALSACGGGSGGGVTAPAAPAPVTTAPATPGTPGTPVTPETPVTPGTPGTPVTPVTPGTPQSALLVSKLEFAQTHVMPEAGLAWTTSKDRQSLHLVGGREALLMVVLGQADAQQPQVQAWKQDVLLGSMALSAPSSLPLTEAGGTRYAQDRWSATLPGAWLVPGVALKFVATNYAASAARQPLVGANSDVALHFLPVYLFGANDSNTFPFATTKSPSAARLNELFAKWPVTSLNVDTIGRLDWPSLVIEPRANAAGVMQPAHVLTSMDQQRDGFAAMSGLLDMIGKFRSANGEGSTNNLYYAPMLPIDTGSGKYHAPGGGLAIVGGGAGVGEYASGGILIHELGHALSLGHAGEAFDSGYYPYTAGTVKGSTWGYDLARKLFLNVLVPVGASSYNGCASSHQVDGSGRCFKQDPMQGGSGDQLSGDAYTMFADFSVGKIQNWFEGDTTVDNSGNHVFNGGRIFVDAKSATGYSRWDGIAGMRVPVAANSTTNRGLYGVLNQGLPVKTGVPVYAIGITMSYAGSTGATQIYPPLARTGNLIAQFDPTSAQDLQAITANTGTYPWYCHASGCDYTLRVRYADGSTIHRVLSGGFREWFKPSDPVPAAASDPLKGASFTRWVVNVPGGQAISKIELLDTPMVWKGMPVTPAVLASR